MYAGAYRHRRTDTRVARVHPVIDHLSYRYPEIRSRDRDKRRQAIQRDCAFFNEHKTTPCTALTPSNRRALYVYIYISMKIIMYSKILISIQVCQLYFYRQPHGKMQTGGLLMRHHRKAGAWRPRHGRLTAPSTGTDMSRRPDCQSVVSGCFIVIHNIDLMVPATVSIENDILTVREP